MKVSKTQRSNQAGVALLMVITLITILTLVLVEFSGTARTHLQSGVNLRDEMRASTMAETALTLTRACLDPAAWDSLKSFQENMDLEQLCRIMLNLFIKARVDLPIGGLSFEMNGIEGIGLFKGDVDIQMKTEESYIGLAGLHCPGRGTTGSNCANRRTTARKLRAILCDPVLEDVFEKPQVDGKEYTRDDIIGNLVDWIDADNNRIVYNPIQGQFSEGAGEGEDSYYRDILNGNGYRSKDAPFDSIEELRLIRGINDRIYDHLKTKVSVHSGGQVDVNFATADVLATLLRAESPWFQAMENQGNACGQDSETLERGEAALNFYVKLIMDARNMRKAPSPLTKPFRGKNGVNDFVTVVKDPLGQILNYGQRMVGSLMQITAQDILARYNLTEAQYLELQGEFARYADNLKDSVTTESKLLRVQAQGAVGNITRRIFAVLKRDGKTVRTLYYREE